MTLQELSEQGYELIDEAARDGKIHAVHNGEFYAAAFWTGDAWALRQGRPTSPLQLLDFEPLYYRPD